MDHSKDELEILDAAREWLKSFNEKDWESFLNIEEKSFGYGYRNRNFRDVHTTESYMKFIDQFDSSFQDFWMEWEDENVRIINGVGFHWGTFKEKITELDGSIRYVKVRSTLTWMKFNDEWKIIFYHRDNIFN